MKNSILILTFLIISFETLGQTTSNPLYLNYNSTQSSASYISSTGSHGNQPKMFFHLPYVGTTGNAVFEWDADDSGSRSAVYQFKASSDRILEIKGWNDGSMSDFWFGDDNNDKFYISDAGKVGIGTSSPNQLLHLRSSSPYMRFELDDGSFSMIEWYETANRVAGIQWLGHQTPNRLSFMTGISSISERMSITEDGKIGIGTTSPDELLHVDRGDVKFEFDSQFGNDPIIMFENEGTNADIRQSFYRWSGNTNLYWGTRFEREASTGFKVQMASPSSLGSHTFVDALTILNSGNVGLGTSSTGSHKLAVEGSIGAREIKVEASGWSDFVFEDDYELRTLEQVEQHINEKGHLPEIPSEEEVTENGINLGEMNAKLLQKIEELTLYMIDMNKEVKQLKSENQELKERLKSLENN